MASKLNATRNNSNPLEVKREPKQQQQQSEDEIEIINEITGGNQNRINPRLIPFKKEPIYFDNPYLTNNQNLYEKIRKLESDKDILLEIIQSKTNEIRKLNQNEIVLTTKINELNEKFKNHLNEINNLRDKLLFTTKETVPVNSNENQSYQTILQHNNSLESN